MQTITISTTQNIDIDYEVAGLGERILARLLDAGVFIALVILIVIAMTLNKNNEQVTIVLMVLIGSTYVFYDLFCEIFFNGQSFGKRVMKIKVISLTGSRPTLSQYALRWLFRIVDFTLTSSLCGLICVAATDKKQRLGDLVAGTTLIKTSARVGITNLTIDPAPDYYIPIFNDVINLSDKDMALINEVIENYRKTGNSVLVYNMASRIAGHLAIVKPTHMDDLRFLQTIVKDYYHLTSNAEV